MLQKSDQSDRTDQSVETGAANQQSLGSAALADPLEPGHESDQGSENLTAAELLAHLRANGVTLTLTADRLHYQGPCDVLAPDHLALIANHKRDLQKLLAAEDHDLRWRMEAMQQAVHVGKPLPVLMAREMTPRAGRCLSCGKPLDVKTTYRCVLCVQAAWLVAAGVHVEENPTPEPGGRGPPAQPLNVLTGTIVERPRRAT